MAKWFVVRGDQERGPFEDAQLKVLAASGKLKPDHRIRRDGSSTVKLAKDIKGLFPSNSAEVIQSPVNDQPLASGNELLPSLPVAWDSLHQRSRQRIQPHFLKSFGILIGIILLLAGGMRGFWNSGATKNKIAPIVGNVPTVTLPTVTPNLPAESTPASSPPPKQKNGERTVPKAAINANELLADANLKAPAVQGYSLFTLVKPVATLRAAVGLEGERIAPDGKHVSMREGGVWNIKTGNELVFEKTPGYPNWSSLSPDGMRVALIYHKRHDILRVYRLNGESPQLESETDLIPDDFQSLEWSSDSRRIGGLNKHKQGIGTADCMNGFVVSLNDGKATLARLSHSTTPFIHFATYDPNLAFSPDGTRCAMGIQTYSPSRNMVDFFETVTGKRLSTFERPTGNDGSLSFVGFSSNAQTCLFSKSQIGTSELSYVLVNTDTAKPEDVLKENEKRELALHLNGPRHFSRPRDVKGLPSDNSSSVTKVYEVRDETANRLLAIVSEKVTAISVNGKYIVTVAPDLVGSKARYGVNVWDIEAGTPTPFQSYASRWDDPSMRPKGPIYFVLTEDEKQQGWTTPETKGGAYLHPAPLITAAKYNQLSEKMSRRKAIELLGGAPHKSHSSSGVEANGHTWWWETTDVYRGNMPGSGAVLVFRRDGKNHAAIGDEILIEKQERGLE